MKVRILTILGVLALGLALTGAMLALAQEGAPAAAPDAEEARELAAAAALAADPGPLFSPNVRTGAIFTPPAVISAPLFVGADDAALFTYLVDPATAAAHPLYDGFRIWGAAFDAANRTVYFNHGPNLYAWPLDGAPGGLGVVKHDTSGNNLSFYGLAAAGGALYGTMPLGSAANPEGVYRIDPATLSATLVITYATPADVDMGGLGADPDTGHFYGTNDEEPQQGLVRINADGTLELLAPYPAGQNDIDGLAIGDGRAFLVPDQPGQIYVFDFATLTYTAPITNPWTTNELFSGAGWISEPAVVTPTISLTKTVGTDPAICATTSAITLPTSGGDVTYCYEVTNTGPITLTLHALDDSELGMILDNFPYTLSPGASAFLTATATITQTTVNTATWTAYNPGPVDEATAVATATVTVPEPAISLTKTVGTDPSICAPASAITLAGGGNVTYCYEVTNTGPITLTLHMLEDSELGGILDDFPYTLSPGASAFLTATATITQTTVNTATWQAYNDGPIDVATATATATVTITDVPTPGIALSATVGEDPNECGTASELSIDMDSDVTLCFTVTNTGNITLTRHSLFEPYLGSVLEDEEYALAPGASLAITRTLPAVTNFLTLTPEWTAYNPGPTDVVTATDTVTISPAVANIVVQPTLIMETVATGEVVTRTVTVSNTGNGVLTFSVDETFCGTLPPWLSAAPASGEVAPGASTEVVLTLDAGDLTPGVHSHTMCLASNDPDDTLFDFDVNLTVIDTNLGLVHFPVVIGD